MWSINSMNCCHTGTAINFLASNFSRERELESSFQTECSTQISYLWNMALYVCVSGTNLEKKKKKIENKCLGKKKLEICNPF